MPAYPMTNVSSASRATPEAGIRATLDDEDIPHYRRENAVPKYTIHIIHDHLTQAELDALLAFTAANGYGPHTFTLFDRDYSGSLLNEPAEIDAHGPWRMVESYFIARRV